jgi:hypothetical protein
MGTRSTSMQYLDNGRHAHEYARHTVNGHVVVVTSSEVKGENVHVSESVVDFEHTGAAEACAA